MTGERISGSATVTLDANGNGSAQVGPQFSSIGWHVERMTTSGTGANQTHLNVCRGSATGPIIDQTELGNGDVSSDGPFDLLPGEYITVAYSKGSPGATCTFYLEGTAI
jgi:hypothetical protein